MRFAILALGLLQQPSHDWIESFLAGSRELERGDLERARVELERVQEIRPGHAASAHALACTSALSGETTRALQWLERASVHGPLDPALLAWEPLLAPLRSDARFQSLLAEARRARRTPVTPPWRIGWSLVQPTDGALAYTVDALATAHTAWVGCEDGSLRELDLDSGRDLQIVQLGGATLRAVAIDAAGSRVAVLDGDGLLTFVDAHAGAKLGELSVLATKRARMSAARVMFAPRGDLLVALVPGLPARVVDVQEQRLVASIDAWNGAASGLRWHPDGERLALVEDERAVTIRHARAPGAAGQSFRIRGPVRALAFEPDGDRLWIGGDDSRVDVFDLATGRSIRTLELGDLDGFDTVEVGCIEFAPDGASAVTTSSGFAVLAVWEVGSGRRRWGYSFTSGNPTPLLAAFDSVGERLLVWGQGAWSQRAFDVRDGTVLHDFSSREGCVMHPAAGGDSFLLAGKRQCEAVVASSGATRWMRTLHPDQGWVLCSRQYADGSPEALRSVQLMLDEGPIELEALAAVLLDPRKRLAETSGVELAPLVLRDIQELQRSGAVAR